MKPTGKGWGVPAPPNDQQNAPGKPTGEACIGCAGPNGIDYHGGPIMPGTVNIYYIWYGTWNGSGANGTNPNSDSPTTQNLLTNLITGLSGSPYEDINTTYFDNSNQVAGLLNMAGSTSDAYSRGNSLGDADIQSIVAAHAGSDLPLDSNGIYMVLTSSDVNETSGFCGRYCGWHTSASINGLDLKYSFVGNGDRCPSNCEAQTTSPNNDSGADGMASVIAHETEEAISDPDLNAWFDSSGNENADKCAWTFGSTFTEPNGSRANMHLDGSDYLIQQNWVNDGGGFCSLFRNRISNIDDQNNWTCTGSCSTSVGTTNQLDGASRKFQYTGGAGFSEGKWTAPLSGNFTVSNAANFTLDFWTFIAQPALSQAIEVHVLDQVGGFFYPFKIQCDFRSSGLWRVYNPATDSWVSTPVGCAVFTANSWDHFILHFHRSGTQLVYQDVEINGTTYSFGNIATNAISQNNPDSLQMQVELIGDSSGSAYALWIDEMSLSF